MNLEFTPEENAFRLQVREWLEANAPKDWSGTVSAGREETMAWEQKLASAGYLVTGWPEEFGGPGWSATQRHIWIEECARASAPAVSAFGVGMCGPVLCKFGTPEQQEEHLTHIRNGTRLWCQGYSEPGAGSDLAALKTRAERDGDEYVVNGQKIWTTSAHIADWMFCLVRTSQGERKQEGISFLLIDMKTPGVEVRAIHTIDGDHHLNEVFLKDVRVPVANLIGKEGRGWTIAKYLLSHERTNIAEVPHSKALLRDTRALVKQDPALAGDAGVEERFAELEVELMALEYTNLRALEQAATGRPPGPESSGLKIKGTELQQDLAEFVVELGAYSSLPWQSGDQDSNPWAKATRLHTIRRAATIYGGSNEIQKGVLAKFALGL